MAYNDVVGEQLRVTIAATYPNEQVEENNVTYVCASAGGGDSRNALGNAILGFYNTNIKPTLATTSQLYGYKVSVLSVHPPPLSVSQASPVDGTAPSGTSLGTQSRPLLRWKTDTGGRSGRGRLYGFTPEISFITDTNIPTAPLLAAYNNLATALGPSITVGGSVWALSLAHRVSTKPTNYTTKLVTDFDVVPVFATQRRSGDTGRKNAPPWT